MKIVSFSGGKDSTAMLIKMVEKKMPIDRVLFADTGKEFPQTYLFIDKVSRWLFSKIGIKIETLKAGKTWDSLFYKVHKTGKNAGKIWGFPYLCNPCWAQRDLKVKVLNKDLTANDTAFIGFALDERKRILKTKFKHKVRYPLIEWQFTESDCFKICEKEGLVNPLYAFGFKRLGCFLCPKQPLSNLPIIKNYFPELWAEILKYEKDSPQGFRPDVVCDALEGE